MANIPDPYPHTSQMRKLDQNDPFHTTTLNEILKPIIAQDKLKILRRQNEHFQVKLFEHDLKSHLPKEKRLELLKNVPECDLLPSMN
jgi:hypothetical protein